MTKTITTEEEKIELEKNQDESDVSGVTIDKMVDDVPLSPEDNILLEEMLMAGLLFGYRKSKSHPKMGKYIFAVRNNIQIFDLIKTIEELKKSVIFLKSIMAKGGKVLFVGTTPSAKELIKEIAIFLKMPYVCERWLGGTMTNFQTIKKRVDYFWDLEKKKETGDLEKYTKKERLLFDRELVKLETKIGGIKTMTKIPEVLFIVDVKANETALNEAKKMKVPVVAICNTNNNPDLIDYVIPANNSAYSSIKFTLDYLRENLIN